MNDRKLHVIKSAHELFVEKGFQATSVQDILDYSGISKGTFYNYFSSKNELLIAIFSSLNQQINEEQDRLLIGQDPANVEIFIQQLELQVAFNQRNKLLRLFEEVFVSNDPSLKEFLKKIQITHLHWIYHRFVDMFDRSKQPYLLDCAIMFTGMFLHNIHYHFLANESESNLNKVIRYTVERLEKMVDDTAQNGVQLLKPEILKQWLPDCNESRREFETHLSNIILSLKQCLSEDADRPKTFELLDFIQEEIIHSRHPRRFLIKSALSSLKENPDSCKKKELKMLEQLVDEFVQ